MKSIQVGDICVWQNQVGELAYLNGTECTVTQTLAPRSTVDAFGQHSLRVCYGVDTKLAIFCGDDVYAEPNDLRLKEEPTPEAEQEYNALIERLTDFTTV